MRTAVLESINQIDDTQTFVEFDVLMKLSEYYTKSYMILENYEGEDIDDFSVFQEAVVLEAKEEKPKETTFRKIDKKTGKMESMLITILKFIPRVLGVCIDFLKRTFGKGKNKIDPPKKTTKEKFQSIWNAVKAHPKMTIGGVVTAIAVPSFIVLRTKSGPNKDIRFRFNSDQDVFEVDNFSFNEYSKALQIFDDQLERKFVDTKDDADVAEKWIKAYKEKSFTEAYEKLKKESKSTSSSLAGKSTDIELKELNDYIDTTNSYQSSIANNLAKIKAKIESEITKLEGKKNAGPGTEGSMVPKINTSEEKTKEEINEKLLKNWQELQKYFASLLNFIQTSGKDIKEKFDQLKELKDCADKITSGEIKELEDIVKSKDHEKTLEIEYTALDIEKADDLFDLFEAFADNDQECDTRPDDGKKYWYDDIEVSTVSRNGKIPLSTIYSDIANFSTIVNIVNKSVTQLCKVKNEKKHTEIATEDNDKEWLDSAKSYLERVIKYTANIKNVINQDKKLKDIYNKLIYACNTCIGKCVEEGKLEKKKGS